uniref:Uncharacterized protein n=1 Tax=Anguilla anguilla TaxID=7936 RepID=A0A0E9UJ18_ANGAN
MLKSTYIQTHDHQKQNPIYNCTLILFLRFTSVQPG